MKKISTFASIFSDSKNNMRKTLLWTMAAMAFCTSARGADDLEIRYDGQTATVRNLQKLDSVTTTVEGAHVCIVSQYTSRKLHVRLRGRSDDGQLILKTAGKAKVKLDNLSLTCQEGAPLWLKNKKKVELVAVDGTRNTLTIVACNDTTSHKAAAIWSKDKVKLSGTGTLSVLSEGDGCKGIRAKDDISIEGLTLTVATTGNNLGEDTTRTMGFGGPPPHFNPEDLPEEVRKRMEEMRSHRTVGNPMGGMHPAVAGDSTHRGAMPPFGMDDKGGMPPGGGKHKYIKTTKGIKSLGRIVMVSGNVTVTTSSPGAEGIEGKEGIELNGGTVSVTAVDDAINANERIFFNGAHVTAISTTNDAVDANYGDNGGVPPFFGQPENSGKKADPAIIITGGTVYAWSQQGPPEEGLDCDSAPIAISGGEIFSIGAGMGDMPSVPTNETARQATVLLVGLNVTKDQPIEICDEKGIRIQSVTPPFSLPRSSSLVSCPRLKVGGTYTVRTADTEKTFTQTDAFTIVR